MNRIEFHVAIERADTVQCAGDPSKSPDLTAAEIQGAIQTALITRLGWHVTMTSVEAGALKVVVS